MLIIEQHTKKKLIIVREKNKGNLPQKHIKFVLEINNIKLNYRTKVIRDVFE